MLCTVGGGRRRADFSFHVFTRRCQWTFLTCSTALMINSAKHWPRHVTHAGAGGRGKQGKPACSCRIAVTERENNSPYSIMAVTFTNKAAAEMRHRIEVGLMGTSEGRNVGRDAFHGLAHRLLRAHIIWTLILPQSFQILIWRSSECVWLKRLIKAIVLMKRWPPRRAM